MPGVERGEVPGQSHALSNGKGVVEHRAGGCGRAGLQSGEEGLMAVVEVCGFNESKCMHYLGFVLALGFDLM